jgi:hypothetical protein
VVTVRQLRAIAATPSSFSAFVASFEMPKSSGSVEVEHIAYEFEPLRSGLDRIEAGPIRCLRYRIQLTSFSNDAIVCRWVAAAVSWDVSACSSTRSSPTASASPSGDGWVLAVEFGKSVPRAYSVLAYGQSPDPASPNHADQAEMFARGEMKPVRFTEADIKKATVREYRPGQ